MTSRNRLITFSVLTLTGLGLPLFAAHSARAQSVAPAPYSELKTLTGYEPSVIASEQQAQAIYEGMPTNVFKGRSGCFQRAHNWAYSLDLGSHIKSMKVFLFFTARYQREFDYDWSYHVAPLMPVKMADGSIQEMVFDPTFTGLPSNASADQSLKYDNKPIPISEWVKYFIFPTAECPLVENYKDYYEFQERYYCYTMKSPMYNYLPDNFDDDLTGETGSLESTNPAWYSQETHTRIGWRPGDLKQMEKAYKAEAR